MQELSDSIKRPNLRFTGITYPKGYVIYSYNANRKFPTSPESLPIQVQEASKAPTKLDQNRTSPQHIIIKMTNIEKTERILKAVREKKQAMYKGNPTKNNSRFLDGTIKTGRAWSEIFQALNEIT
jgi:hypothetical protein